MKRIPFVVALILFVGIGAVIRQNNATTAKNQAAVLATLTDATTTTAKLTDLKKYVMNHSGSSVTVTLTAAYNQAVDAADLAATTTPSTTLYAQAQAACQGRGVSSVTQAQCNEDYITAHSAGTSTTTTVTPPAESDYVYHLVAPVLTFDAASLMFVLAFASLVGIVLPVGRVKPHSYL